VLRIGLSLLILGFLFYKIDLNSFASAILKFNLLYIIPFCVSVFLLSVISSLNLKILFDEIKKTSFLEIFKAYCLSVVVSIFAPGKLGEFSIVYFFKKQGIEPGKGTAVFFFDKAVTLLFIGFFAMIAFYRFLEFSEFVIVTLSLFLVGVIGAGLFLSNFGRNFLKKILGKYGELFTGFFSTLKFFSTRKKTVALNMFLTLVRWFVVQTLAVYLLFLGFGVSVDFVGLFLASTAASIATLIPFTFNGLGIREGVFALFMLKLGVPIEISLAVSVISIVFSNLYYFLMSQIFFKTLLKSD
ncbi:MAG: lysylphosphatidylglycerol synthase transmembrane domain-containing protein, partial [Candidatus Diapherotrites archaeon]|nr:lysylphosphatidylglycerol synthase transmembrane domain-containing protein [Candidatus Diapherotrites archaeon]